MLVGKVALATGTMQAFHSACWHEASLCVTALLNCIFIGVVENEDVAIKKLGGIKTLSKVDMSGAPMKLGYEIGLV